MATTIRGPAPLPSTVQVPRNTLTIVLMATGVAVVVLVATFWAAGAFTSSSSPSTATTGPAAPTGLTEVSATTSSLTVSWNPAATTPTSGAVTGYEISYTEGHSPTTCGIWGPFTNVGSSLSATVAGLSEDTTYCFQVVAVSAGGTSPGSVWLTDAETLGPEGQATNALDATNVVSTQSFSVVSGQLMLATVSSYGGNATTPVLTTQNGQTFSLVTLSANALDPALVTYVFDRVANLTTSDEVVTLSDAVASQYMLGIVSYFGATGVIALGPWETASGTTDTANVSTVADATLVACIGYVTDVGGASFTPGYLHATWTAATFNSRADQWYLPGGAAAGENVATVTRGLAGDTSMILLALA